MAYKKVQLMLTPEEKAKLEKRKVKEFYQSKYADDTLGNDLKDDVTFLDIVAGLNEGKDIYEVFGVGYSIIRERIFGELSELLDVDYDVIYTLWLGR